MSSRSCSIGTRQVCAVHADILRQLRLHFPGIVWSNVNTGVIALSGLIMSVLFARLGTKELYGQYLFVLALVHLFSVLSVSGSRTVVLRTTAQSYDGVYRIATRFSFVRSLFAIPLLTITGVLLYYFGSPMLGLGSILAGVFLPFVTSLENWMSFLKGRADFSRLALFNLIRFGASLVAVGGAILLTNGLIPVLLAYFTVHSVFNALYFLRSLAFLRNADIDPGWHRQSYALTIMELSSVVFGEVDILLIAALLPVERVAIYGLVMRITGAFLTGTKSTVEGILPSLFRSETITIRYFYRFALLFAVGTAAITLLVKYAIPVIYGPAYAEVVRYTQVYLLIIPVHFLNAISTCFMIKYDLNKAINISKITAIVCVVLLYICLIPLYGIWGGVISSMLYFVVQLGMNLFLMMTARVRSSCHAGQMQPIP